MLNILRFELRYQLKHPAFYGLLVLYSCLMWDVGQTLEDTGALAANSAYLVQQGLMGLCVLAVLGVIAIVAAGALRDETHKTYALLFTTPIRPYQYVLGRYLGGVIAVGGVMGGACVAFVLGSEVSWDESNPRIAFNLSAYAYAMGVFVLPNILILGALFFTLARATRRMLWVYVGMFALYLLLSLNAMYIRPVEMMILADPFGFQAFHYFTRHWTPLQKNTQLLGFEPLFMMNRLIWLSVSVGLMGLNVWTTRLCTPRVKGRRVSKERSTPPTAVPQTVARIFRFRTTLLQTLHQARVEVKGVFYSTPFAVILLVIFFHLNLSMRVMLHAQEGPEQLPITMLMLDPINEHMPLYIVLVISIYAGEMVWMERVWGLSDILDASPVPNGVAFFAKLVALWAIVVALLGYGVVNAIAIQWANEAATFEPLVYGMDVFLLGVLRYAPLCVLALFVQTVLPHRIAGYAAMLVYVLWDQTRFGSGLEHPLFCFASAPELAYSDMNGYGHGLEPVLWYRLFWILVSVGLGALTYRLWRRGQDRGLFIRWVRGPGLRGKTAVISTVIWLLSIGVLGTFIVYETAIVKPYETAAKEQAWKAAYERRYKSYEGQPQPAKIRVDVNVDIFSEAREVWSRGAMVLKNNTDAPIRTVYLGVHPKSVIERLEVPGGQLVKDDTEMGVRIYELLEPLMPGQSSTVTFAQGYAPRGFAQEAGIERIALNGTFLMADFIIPRVGYTSIHELVEPAERRAFGLAERPTLASEDDEVARRRTVGNLSQERLMLRSTVSTRSDQTAFAPGELMNAWEKDGRRYFEYVTEAPIWDLFGYASGRYEVKRRSHAGVNIEIHYHPGHQENIDAMLQAAADTVEHASATLGPYRHRSLRVVELPRYFGSAMSFATLIPFSETVGFVNDGRSPLKLDDVRMVTAHEVAHQWWGHKIMGADVEGGSFLVEGMAQYTSLVIMEEKLGAHRMKPYLERELQGYLRGRSRTGQPETPLSRVGHRMQHVKYNKGGLAMYALRAYLGEEAVNLALRRFSEKTAGRPAPYPTTRMLVDELRAVAPPRYVYLVDDLFHDVVLYDGRAISARARPLERGTYEITIEVEIRKLRVDEAGHEVEVPMDDWVPVGAVRSTHQIGEPTMHRLPNGRSTVTIEVQGLPRRAGFDPRGVLIDRNPRDNLVEVDRDDA